MKNEAARLAGITEHDRHDQAISNFYGQKHQYTGKVSGYKLNTSRTLYLRPLYAAVVVGAGVSMSMVFAHPAPGVIGVLLLCVGFQVRVRAKRIPVVMDSVTYEASRAFPSEQIPPDILNGKLVGSEQWIRAGNDVGRYDQLFDTASGLTLCDTKTRRAHAVRLSDVEQLQRYQDIMRRMDLYRHRLMAPHGYIRTVTRGQADRSVKWHRVPLDG